MKYRIIEIRTIDRLDWKYEYAVQYKGWLGWEYDMYYSKSGYKLKSIFDTIGEAQTRMNMLIEGDYKETIILESK